MKYLILVGDGMGDYPLAELNSRTPLEAAHTPMMDELCMMGEFFFTQTVPAGFPPGSDVANMSLMGYDPARYYTGRAPIEAAAMGIRLAADETAFRCNLVTLEHGDNGRITMQDFSAGHITSEEAHHLIGDLNTECGSEQFQFKPGVSYRHLMIYKGALPNFVTVPPHDYIEQDVSKHLQAYQQNSDWGSLLTKAGNLLRDHPVNLHRMQNGQNPATLIWLWGEGKMPCVPALTERFNISGTMISAVDLLKGLGVLAGLSVVNVDGATGFIDTNYEGKAQAAIHALRSQDFVFVHLEAPDESGHQGSLKNKITAIEDFDGRIVQPIVKSLRSDKEDFRVVVTMDHFTPLSLRTHVSDPVPTLLYDSREQKKGSGHLFNEASCTVYNGQKNNSINNGHQLIEKLFEQSI